MNNEEELNLIYKRISALEIIEKLKRCGIAWRQVDPFLFTASVAQGSHIWDIFISKNTLVDLITMDFRRDLQYFFSMKSDEEPDLENLFEELVGDQEYERDKDILNSLSSLPYCYGENIIDPIDPAEPPACTACTSTTDICCELVGGNPNLDLIGYITNKQGCMVDLPDVIHFIAAPDLFTPGKYRYQVTTPFLACGFNQSQMWLDLCSHEDGNPQIILGTMACVSTCYKAIPFCAVMNMVNNFPPTNTATLTIREQVAPPDVVLGGSANVSLVENQQTSGGGKVGGRAIIRLNGEPLCGCVTLSGGTCNGLCLSRCLNATATNKSGIFLDLPDDFIFTNTVGSLWYANLDMCLPSGLLIKFHPSTNFLEGVAGEFNEIVLFSTVLVVDPSVLISFSCDPFSFVFGINASQDCNGNNAIGQGSAIITITE